MASMRDIKRRKVSIQSTQQITKAMKLVATVKLQRAKQAAERSKAYFNAMYETVMSVLEKAGNIDHPYLKAVSGKKAVVVITSNRGLAGGYNSNVIKLVTRGEFKTGDTSIFAIGKKGRDALSRAGFTIMAENLSIVEEPTYADAMNIAKTLLKSFEQGEISEIYLAYASFKNTVTQVPTLLRLLPVKTETNAEDNVAANDSDEDKKPQALMNFEPEEEEALELIIPKYITSLIYGGLVEANASENGARMQAMDSATSNAEDMIEDLTLLYNRARQSSITQELTEIIAGAEAIS